MRGAVQSQKLRVQRYPPTPGFFGTNWGSDRKQGGWQKERTENTGKSSLQPTVYSPLLKRKEEQEHRDRRPRKALWVDGWRAWEEVLPFAVCGRLAQDGHPLPDGQLEGAEGKEKQREGERRFGRQARESLAGGRGRGGADQSQSMILQYLPSVNQYLWGTKFETGTRGGRKAEPKTQVPKPNPGHAPRLSASMEVVQAMPSARFPN
jgi:hypothetical protein